MEEKKYYMKSLIFMKVMLIPFIGFFIYLLIYSVGELIESPSVFYIIMLGVVAFIFMIVIYFVKVSYLKTPMLEINNERLIIRTNVFKKEVLVRDINAVFGKKIFTNRVLEIMLYNGKKIIVPLNQVDCDTDEVVEVIKGFAGLNKNSWVNNSYIGNDFFKISCYFFILFSHLQNFISTIKCVIIQIVNIAF